MHKYMLMGYTHVDELLYNMLTSNSESTFSFHTVTTTGLA